MMDEAINLYRKGYSIRKIETMLGIDRKKLSLTLKELGEEIRGRESYLQPRKYEVYEKFFEKIDSEDKAYILGFLQTDGNLRKGEVRWKISVKDLDILHKLGKVVFKGEYPIGEHPKVKQVSLSIRSVKMEQDLRKLGITENKTYNTPFLPIQEPLLRHYLRGLIDGDGTVYYKKTPLVAFGGASFDLVSKIKCHFEQLTQKIVKLNDQFELEREGKRKSKGFTHNFYDFSFHGVAAYEIIKYLYQDAHIYINRKYEVYLKTKHRKPKPRREGYSDEMIREIRRQAMLGKTGMEISRMFNIPSRGVYNIINYKSYKNVQ